VAASDALPDDTVPPTQQVEAPPATSTSLNEQTGEQAVATVAPPPTEAPAVVHSPTPAEPAEVRAMSAPTGSHVAVHGSGYRYTLTADGRPWVVRGMGYNPWYASLPTDQRQARYRRDFSLMRETGINTLEGWFQDQFDEVTLDEAHRYGLKVIMPFELNQDYDYTDPAVRARFRAEVTAWVLRYRDHPAVLMWGPGNEVMHRLIFPTAVQGKRDLAREQRADAFAAFYVELMDLVHELDPHHPVIYRDAEDLYLTRFREQIQQRPASRPWFVYGTNVYTSRIAEVIRRWPTQGLDAPLLVSEFSPGGAGESDRPRMLHWYWSTIRHHPERVLGGVVYTWATRGPEDLDRVFGLTDDAGAPVDGSLAALEQLFRPDLPNNRNPT
jgi:beta-galactosidase/beta-glucuronidase